jgi:DNA repair protein RadC
LKSKSKKEKGQPKAFLFYVKEAPISAKPIETNLELFLRMEELAKADQESFWVIAFNAAHEEIYHECLFLGGLESCNVDIRLLFRRLLTVGAHAFVVVHNHPNGKHSPPSKGDIEVTEKIREVSEIVGIRFLDHIIIGDNGCGSFEKWLYPWKYY